MKKETAAVNSFAIGKDNQTRLEALPKLININAIGTNKIINLSKDIIRGVTDFAHIARNNGFFHLYYSFLAFSFLAFR